MSDNSRPVGRLGLGSGSHVVGQLGSGVWVRASFQIFAFTDVENILGGEGSCPAREMSGGGICRRGKCPAGMSYASPGTDQTAFAKDKAEQRLDEPM